MPAYYRHGETTMVDHTPGAAVAAGQITTQGIAHSPIAASELGALSAPNGDAVYEVDKDDATDVFAVLALVDFDASFNAVPAGDGTQFGQCVKASANGDTTVWVRQTGLLPTLT